MVIIIIIIITAFVFHPVLEYYHDATVIELNSHSHFKTKKA